MVTGNFEEFGRHSFRRARSEHPDESEKGDLDQESGAHDGDRQEYVAWFHERPRVWRSPYTKFICIGKCFGSNRVGRETL